MEKTKELTVDAVVQNITAVTVFVTDELNRMHCPEKVMTQIKIAIDELFNNITSYAYDKAPGTVTVILKDEENVSSIEITFVDSGRPFDPVNAKAPDLSSEVRKKQIGGLGIYITKTIMDDVNYEYVDGQNRLTIIKRWEPVK